MEFIMSLELIFKFMSYACIIEINLVKNLTKLFNQVFFPQVGIFSAAVF